MQEIWKTVVYDGEVFEGYEVSNLGKIRSLNYGRTGEVKELRLIVSKGGYLVVNLCKDGKYKSCRVHRLVAFAFIPNDDTENKTDVNHIDEDKTNNTVENLEWCTREYNINYGTHNERVAKTLGKKTICVETGIVYESTREVERKLGLEHSDISKCCKGKIKTFGGYQWMYYSDYLKLNNENSDSKEEND